MSAHDILTGWWCIGGSGARLVGVCAVLLPLGNTASVATPSVTFKDRSWLTYILTALSDGYRWCATPEVSLSAMRFKIKSPQCVSLGSDGEIGVLTYTDAVRKLPQDLECTHNESQSFNRRMTYRFGHRSGVQ